MGPPDGDRALLDAARERAEIVRRYDRGRDQEAAIDEWEDPAFEVYHTTDRYGFIHDSRIPRESDDAEKVATAKEVEREAKWSKMNQKWSKYNYMVNQSTKSEKLRARVWKGIPEVWRGEIWKKLLQIEDVKKDQREVYEKMKLRARTTSPDIRQIDLDVNRTYRNHIMFRERYGIKQTHLFHVLAAYSMYNTEVGYCQGMSQIAALLLMYMDEEDAFWGLSQLLTDKKHAMHGLFIPGFPKLMRYQNHFENILKKFMPKIYKFMNANMIPPSLYAIKWFMQCFLDRTPFSLTLRLWDVFMLDGERILIPMAYTIFKVHKKKLLKMSMEQFVGFLQQELEKDFGLDDDAVLIELNAVILELRRSRVDIPPRATNLDEIPSKPFGCVTYPTEEELLKRQEGQQININDEPSKSSSHGFPNSVPLRANADAGLPTHNDSFRSVYDNHPDIQSQESVPPHIDYNEMSGGRGDRGDRDENRHHDKSRYISPRSVNSRISVQSNSSIKDGRTEISPQRRYVDTSPRLVSSRTGDFVLETHLPVVERDASPPSRQQSTDSAISEGADIVVLKLDLSDDEDKVASPVTEISPPTRETYFESDLEWSLSETVRNSRSASRSPDLDALEGGAGASHMYVRSTGFRARNLSPGGASRGSSNPSSPTQTVPDSSNIGFYRPDINPAASTTAPGRGSVELPIRHSNLDGGVEIPITHSNGSAGRSFTRLRSPDDRLAYNPNYSNRLAQSLPRSPRPFPVPPRSNIPVMMNSSIRTHTRPSEFGGVPTAALHMISPTPRAADPVVSHIPSYIHNRHPTSPTPYNHNAHSTSLMSAPLGYDRPIFYTFGGRGRQRQSPPPPNTVNMQSQTHRSFDNLTSRDARHAVGISNNTGIPSTRSPRFVSGNSKPNQISPSGSKTFYVVGDSAGRQGSVRTPCRYNFDEGDDNNPSSNYV